MIAESGYINDNGTIILPKDRLTEFANLHKGERVVVTFEAYPRRTTNSMVGYYFGYVIPTIITALKELGWELGQTSKAKSIVDHWLMACNPFSDKPIRQMSLDEAGEYLEWIKQFAAEWLSVYIEEPKTL